MSAYPGLIEGERHDAELVAAVHPEHWLVPTPPRRYDLVVIGGGTAGLVSAAGAATLGARVALVERQLLGGDCLNYGCVPSKALLHAARTVHRARGASAFGVRCDGAADFAAAMTRLRARRAQIGHHDAADRFRAMGVDVFLGHARFTARDAVDVGGLALRFERAVIATGARAAGLPVPGLDDAGFLTNETVFGLTALPRRLLVVGAGPIGCELAQAFQRLGSRVSVIANSDRALDKDDPDASRIVQETMAAEGVTFELGAELVSVARRGGDKVITFRRDGVTSEIAGDEILVSVGRQPNVDDLGLEAAGVAYSRRGVAVDDHMRTGNRRVFAAGDVCSAYQFTHAADAMARLVLRNALFFGRGRASRLVIPWTTYTDPEVAHVGVSAGDAERRGLATFTVPFSEVDRALVDDEASSAFTPIGAGRSSAARSSRATPAISSVSWRWP